MRLLCVHCDHRFEADERPKRCPSCMRTGGIEDLGGPAESAGGSSKAGLIAVLVLLVAAVGGYAWWAARTPEITDQVPSRPLSGAEVEGHGKRLRADAGQLAQLLEPTVEVEKFASGVDGEPAKAVFDAIRARAGKGAFVPWSLGEPKMGSVGLPAATLKVLEKDKGRAELYPLELAALMVAALRSLDVTAMVAELADSDEDRAPLDGTGYLGYFVVAVYDNDDAEGTPRLFDPFGGRKLDAERSPITVLDDMMAIGAALSLRGIGEVSQSNDTKAAMASTSAAISLAGRLPCVRSARGVVLLAAGQVERALAELEAARQLRADAARLHALASAAMLTRDLTAANANLSKALSKKPDYANARVILALVQLHEGKSDEVRAELEHATRLAPTLSIVDRAWAQYYAAEGELARALHYATRSVERRPTFETRLQLGHLYRAMGKYDEMRKVARSIMDDAPSYRHPELTMALEKVLGPTALEQDDEDDDALAEDDGEALAGPALPTPELGKLQLGGDSKLLQDADGEKDLELKAGADGEPLLLLGDPSKLRLRGQGQRLKLNLSD